MNDIIVVVLIISGNECGIKSGRIVFLLYLFFRRLLLNRKITMVIISGWAGVTYASECFLPGLPSLQRKSLWKRGNHQALFESYAPIINCLERKNYGATWCYDSFHSSFFLSIAFRMVSNLRIRHFFGFSGCWQMHVKRLFHRIKPGYHKRCHVQGCSCLRTRTGVVRPADMCGITGMLCELNCVLLAGDVYWWFGSV